MDSEVLKEANEAENANKLNHKKTELKKYQFINEIKNGYGKEIKNAVEGKAPPKGFLGWVNKILKMF